jgi:signal transduction histidine kinase
MGEALQKQQDETESLREQLAEQSRELIRIQRQLEIEDALEKIRLKATGMRKSAELAETSAVLFEQIKQIGLPAIRTSVGIFDDANQAMEMWQSSYSESGEVLRVLDYVNIHVHPVFENIIPARNQNKPFSLTHLSGQQVRNYYEQMSTHAFIHQPLVYNEDEFFYSFFFSGGALNVVTGRELNEDESNIIIRFAHAFGLIYTRFLDLLKAEAQAREAQIETALERVRTRTMAMQKSSEIRETTKLLFHEFSELGESVERVSIGIISETGKVMNVWAANFGDIHPDVIYEFPLSEPHVVKKMYDAWKSQKKSITIELEGEDLQEYFKVVVSLGVPLNSDDFTEKRIHNTAIFSRGVICFITPEPRPESSILLFEKFAAVFDLTYTRFLDLRLAEAQAIQAELDLERLQEEKKNTENALADLKATQAQLIQAEKMASLGELTAGIAHEIKNPLNFINNFAEINKELIGELHEELDAGNLPAIRELANDIRDNEEKIIHHGKRADSIVKSMLQHSRTGSIKKEPTDINGLCDEYLRLSYHGLRAKDKSFNAKFEFEPDKTIPMVNVVPQEIGRVILNLINNAFYASSKKAEVMISEFTPTVIIKTRNLGDKLQISVKDNGNGIPEKDLYKIFHPFFTTKPAGEGTGLGLSISYDIIKAHGGDLRVESSPGRWCLFIVELPISKEGERIN